MFPTLHNALARRFASIITATLLAFWAVPAGQAQTIYETNVFVETIAGSGIAGYLDGNGTQTMVNRPTHLVVDRSTNVFFWDSGNYRVRKITPDGTVSTFVGGRSAGSPIGQGTNVAMADFGDLADLGDMAMDTSGNILFNYQNAILKITASATVSLFAGNINDSDYIDRPLTNARFHTISGLAVDTAGNIFVADQENYRIRKITSDGIVSTFAGSGNQGFSRDGTGIFSAFQFVEALAIDSADNLFVIDHKQYDSCYQIRRINPQGVVTTLPLKCARSGYSIDGFGTNATTRSAGALACDSLGNIILADLYSIRRISPEGNVTTLAGKSVSGFADGNGASALFRQPYGLAIDSQGRVYVADSYDHRIRRITHGLVPTSQFDLDLYAGLSIKGTIGRRYRIEAVNTLSGSPAWTTLAEITLTTSPYLWFDPESAQRPRRFYRAVRLP